MDKWALIITAGASLISAGVSFFIFWTIFKTLSVSRITTLIKIEKDFYETSNAYAEVKKESEKKPKSQKLKKEARDKRVFHINTFDRFCFFILSSNRKFQKQMRCEFGNMFVLKSKNHNAIINDSSYPNIKQLFKKWNIEIKGDDSSKES